MPTAFDLATDRQQLHVILNAYHSAHADTHGDSLEFCDDVTCIEGRWALEWLASAVHQALGARFAYVRFQGFTGTFCLDCLRVLAWSPTIAPLMIAQRAHLCQVQVRKPSGRATVEQNNLRSWPVDRRSRS